MYGCHAYPKKTPNTRGGDYQRRDGSLEIQIVKTGVLQSDTRYTRKLYAHLLIVGVKLSQSDATLRRTRDHVSVA